MTNIPMNWEKLLSTQRFVCENGRVSLLPPSDNKEDAAALRTDFHVDYDRIVFSGAFRRLGRKTQVHSFARHDHTHNRLTHSVEVASVGRSLGNRVGVMMAQGGFLPAGNSPADLGTLVQVACLAHDLGNPPFGHTGEDALREWFRAEAHAGYLKNLTAAECADIQTYEGNAHSLRLLARLEMYRNRGGMRLTAASVGTLMKYPWTTSAPSGRSKFNIYQTELPFIRAVADALGLPETAPQQWLRHPLSYLMEAADDICYALLDLEDAAELGLLHESEVESIFQRIAPLDAVWQEDSPRRRLAILRGNAIGRAIEDVAQTFMRHQSDLLSGRFLGKDLIALCSPDVRDTLSEAKELARTRVFRHPGKLMTEIAAFPCLGSVLDLLVPAAHDWLTDRALGTRASLALDLLSEDPICRDDSLYAAYMKILDYVGGMTDNTAARLAQDISGYGMM